MALLGACLLRRNRRFSFRSRVPAALVGRIHRRELVRTLGTSDPALARLRAAAIALHLPELWKRAESVVTDEEAERLVNEWFKEALAEAYRPLGRGIFAQDLAPAGADEEELEEINRRWTREDAELAAESLAEERRAGRITTGRHLARALLTKHGHSVDEGDQRFGGMCQRLMEAAGVVQEARLQWAAGNHAFTPTLMPPPGPDAGSHLAEAVPVAPCEPSAVRLVPGGDLVDRADSASLPGRTLGDAIALFLDLRRRERRFTEKQVTQASGELFVLTDAFGNTRRTGDVSAADAGKVFEALRFLPKRFRHHPKLAGLPFFEQAETARRLELAPLHPRTIKGYLGTIRSLFEQEKKAGLIASNPFAGMDVHVPPDGENERPFTDIDEAVIFSQPLFTGAQREGMPFTPGTFLISDWRFWAPLLALLSGARVAELAQLTPDDVRTVEGQWVIDINAKGGKRLKAAGSARLIPIHSELIRLGLLDLAEAQRAAGKERLLPRVPAPVGGDPGKQLSKWMSEKVLPRLGIRRPLLGFHSFRHALATRLREADVDEPIAGRIMGHKGNSVTGRYGKFSPKMLAESLERVSLPAALASIPRRESGCR